MDWLLNIKKYRNIKLGAFFMSTTSALLLKYKSLPKDEIAALRKLFNDTESLHYQSISKLA